MDANCTYTISIGIDEANIQAHQELHGQWALEQCGHAMDNTHWYEMLKAKILSRAWILVVVYCNGIPIGISECMLSRNHLDGNLYGYGDQAFIAKAHRNQHVFRMILDAAENISIFLGLHATMVPVAVSGPSAFLADVYTAMGFTPEITLMKRLVVR